MGHGQRAVLQFLQQSQPLFLQQALQHFTALLFTVLYSTFYSKPSSPWANRPGNEPKAQMF
jgi:hypothetical protein